MNIQQSNITSKAPVITEMQVVPVAGHDDMLLNLSGAHGPYFTRNVIILKTTQGMSVGRSAWRRADSPDAGRRAIAGRRQQHWHLPEDS